MIASAMSIKTVQECLDENVTCNYFVAPTPICSINKDGIKQKFIGACELSHVNKCVEPDGIYF